MSENLQQLNVLLDDAIDLEAETNTQLMNLAIEREAIYPHTSIVVTNLIDTTGTTRRDVRIFRKDLHRCCGFPGTDNPFHPLELAKYKEDMDALIATAMTRGERLEHSDMVRELARLGDKLGAVRTTISKLRKDIEVEEAKQQEAQRIERLIQIEKTKRLDREEKARIEAQRKELEKRVAARKEQRKQKVQMKRIEAEQKEDLILRARQILIPLDTSLPPSPWKIIKGIFSIGARHE